jgi:hypothetical protein
MASDLEEDVLEPTNRGFGAEFRGVGNDLRDGFEDACPGGDDEATRRGDVPVATILENVRGECDEGRECLHLHH